MKTVKYILIGAMMTAISAPVMAQDAATVVPQATEIIKSKAADADKQVTNLYKTVKKDAKAVAGIGRAYLSVGDTANASRYAELAVKANKKAADGYLLKGRIAESVNDPGTAASMYQTAYTFDPKCAEAYARYASVYAKADTEGALQSLNKVKEIDPSYPVDITAAEMLYSVNKQPAKAIEYYGKVSFDKMDQSNLLHYAALLYGNGDYKKALEVVNYGHKSFPKDLTFNRIAMLSNIKLENYEDAVKSGYSLFNECDLKEYQADDYTEYAKALLKLKKNDEAIDVLKKMGDDNNISNDDKLSAFKQLSDAYKAKSDYDNAIAYYEKYMKAQPKMTANVKNGLALIYRSRALEDGITADQKKEYINKADQVFSEIATEFPEFEQTVLVQRAKLPFILDPEDKSGLAKPIYDKLIDLITNNKEDITDSQKASNNKQLEQAYQYNMVYYFQIKKDVPTAKTYAAKILEINPDNEVAKTVAGLK